MVASELDSFDGRKDPERCSALVNQLRMCQDRVLTIIGNIMDEAILDRRSSRDFRVKFPDDVLQESLAGQLWFGAEVSPTSDTFQTLHKTVRMQIVVYTVLQIDTSPLVHFDLILVWTTKTQYLLAQFLT